MAIAWRSVFYRAATLLLACTLSLGASANEASSQAAPTSGPFVALAGWWGGEGRLRFKDGKMEQVKCRATYFVDTPDDLRQTIRCASASGKIELTSNVKHAGRKLTGAWTEAVYNITGALTGEVTPKGYRVEVKGTEGSTLSANMDIIVRDKRQIVEIQFFSETLIGLTLMLNKG